MWTINTLRRAAVLLPIVVPVAHAQGRERMPVILTIAEAKWNGGGPSAVIVPESDGRATIVLRGDATPEDLFAAVSILDSKRSQASYIQSVGKHIVVGQTRLVERLPPGLRTRLAAYLNALKTASEREVIRFGRTKAVEVQLRLRRVPVN